MKRIISLPVLLALALLGPSAAAVAQTSDPAIESAFTPTAAERERAIGLASEAIAQRGLRGNGLLYHISASLYQDKRAAAGDRLVLVTSYRYEGDLGIFSFLNLSRGTVEAVRAVPHAAVHLSAAEFELARSKAFADPQVVAQLGDYRDKVIVEAMVSHSSYERDPWFGHRVVRLLFKLPPDSYLVNPIVFVDLTSGQVLIDQVTHTNHLSRSSREITPAAPGHTHK
jgi:hypothetical protein